MSEKTIRVKIITPEKVVCDADANELYAQGSAGSFGILPDHIPFMATLATGIAKTVTNSEEKFYTVMGGAFQFKNNEAVILTEAAEAGADIDVARAKLAKERAEAALGSAETERDIKLANAALARAMVRLKLAGKQ